METMTDPVAKGTPRGNTFNDQPWRDAGVNEGNFITPHVLLRGRCGDWAWEISEGTGFDHEPIFGVTFLYWDGTGWLKGWETDGDPSQLTHMLEDAYETVRNVVS